MIAPATSQIPAAEAGDNRTDIQMWSVQVRHTGQTCDNAADIEDLRHRVNYDGKDAHGQQRF